YRAALETDRALTLLDPGNFQAALDLSFSETKVKTALIRLKQTQEGLTDLRAGITRQKALLGTDSNHVLMYNHLTNGYTLLTNSLLATDRKHAIEYYKKAINSRLTLAGKSPNSSMNRGALADCYANLAKAIASENRKDALHEYDNA